MAGVQVVKTTTAKVAHQSCHYSEERRKVASHRNRQIDPSKSHLNYNLGQSSWKEIMSTAKEQVKTLDRGNPPKRKKEDRKDMLTFIIYCPEELADKNKEFFEKVYAKYE